MNERLERPFYTMEELANVFGYKNKNSLDMAIRRGSLEVPTYKCAGRRVADKQVVAAYFQERRAEGLRQVVPGLSDAVSLFKSEAS
tara:strand:- start:2124 stop:2381 length:258 start_codon:yes stop_codon:yes gene_type:complete